jgi:YafQ family addiction module toxin component
MYSCEMRKKVEHELFKLVKKDRTQMEAINKKINEITSNPYHYKNLRAPLSHLHRVHVDKSFVLLFSIDEERKTVIIEEYAHHDEIYKKSYQKF